MFGFTGFAVGPFASDEVLGPVDVTGVAATGGVGSVVIDGDGIVSVTGLEATGEVG